MSESGDWLDTGCPKQPRCPSWQKHIWAACCWTTDHRHQHAHGPTAPKLQILSRIFSPISIHVQIFQKYICGSLSQLGFLVGSSPKFMFMGPTFVFCHFWHLGGFANTLCVNIAGAVNAATALSVCSIELSFTQFMSTLKTRCHLLVLSQQGKKWRKGWKIYKFFALLQKIFLQLNFGIFILMITGSPGIGDPPVEQHPTTCRRFRVRWCRPGVPLGTTVYHHVPPWCIIRVPPWCHPGATLTGLPATGNLFNRMKSQIGIQADCESLTAAIPRGFKGTMSC